MERGSSTASVALAVAACMLLAIGALSAIAAFSRSPQPPGPAPDESGAALNVRAFGAKGDARTDDTTAFVAALEAAARSGRRLFVPAGVYRLGSLAVPDGVRLEGAGRGSTWLKGQLVFGSDQRISDLRIGDSGASATHNNDGASGTVFERCRFRGGGGRGVDEPVIALGYEGDCSDILFSDCAVECNLGVEDAGFTRAFNDITVFETTGAHVRGITFERCHVGVSNGVRTGSPRMGLECYTVQLSEGGSGRGYEDITVRDCVFEAADAHCIDLADAADGRADGVLIEGCLLKGGGKAQTKWGYTICVESPTGVVIRDNTIWRGNWQTLNFAHPHESGPGTIISGNDFDLTHDNGIPTAQYNPVFITGRGVRFTDNTLSFAGQHQFIIQLNNASHCVITGNTFIIGSKAISHAYNDSHHNTVADNIVR